MIEEMDYNSPMYFARVESFLFFAIGVIFLLALGRWEGRCPPSYRRANVYFTNAHNLFFALRIDLSLSFRRAKSCAAVLSGGWRPLRAAVLPAIAAQFFILL